MRIALPILLALAFVGAAAGVAAPTRATVSVRGTALGRVLVDAHGRTLYVFDRDVRGRSACSGACAAAWPPFLTSGTPVALAGVPATRLGTARRGDGRLQVTYMGRPLYFFARDRRAGQVAGAAIPHWAALTAAGARLHRSSTPHGTPSPSPAPPSYGGGGDGY